MVIDPTLSGASSGWRYSLRHEFVASNFSCDLVKHAVDDARLIVIEERVRDVIENETYRNNGKSEPPPPTCVQFGGQTAVNLATVLSRPGLPILGSGAEA